MQSTDTTEPTIIREAPAGARLSPGTGEPTKPDVRNDVTPENREPILAVANIQGNILGGFNKDHQIMLYLRIVTIAPFKKWLAAQTPFVSTAAEVIAFNRLFKELRSRRHREGYLKATWMNIAFSYAGLRKLNPHADQFIDPSFKAGLLQRSAALGDPQDGRPGDPKRWLVGGPNNEADVVLIVAADDRGDLLAEVDRLEGSLVGSGALLLLRDEAENLPAPLSGHEHFGFLDGVSQPGVRGVVSDSPNDVLTPRQNLNEKHTKDKPGQGKPGQDVLWPGEFVFGYQGGDPTSFETPTHNSVDGGPAWAKDGSLLVIRRLHQDVAGFHTFLKETAQNLGVPAPPQSSAARYVGSRLVGRWPSGCPVLRSPGDDLFAMGGDDCANNNFEFAGKTDPLPHTAKGDYCTENTAVFLPSPGDPAGAICPFSGHIRKSYPRNDAPIVRSADPDVNGCRSRLDLNEDNTQKHRMLRRGIPYGPVSPSSPDAPVFDTVDRGLQFLSYQTSLTGQFEFIIRCWVNNENFKEGAGADASHPNNTGHDPILGQNPTGPRAFDVTLPFDDPLQPNAVRVTTDKSWVWATGGGYFFSPSLDALKNHLS